MRIILPVVSEPVIWRPSLVTQAVTVRYSEAKLGREHDMMASLEDITNVSPTRVSYSCPATAHRNKNSLTINQV